MTLDSTWQNEVVFNTSDLQLHLDSRKKATTNLEKKIANSWERSQKFKLKKRELTNFLFYFKKEQIYEGKKITTKNKFTKKP